MARKRIKPGKEYNKCIVELATKWLDITPCAHCGHPAPKGYCCPNCKSVHPQGHPSDMSEKDKVVDLEEWV